MSEEDQTIEEIIEACADRKKLREALLECRSQRNTWCDEANGLEDEESKVDDDQALAVILERK